MSLEENKALVEAACRAVNDRNVTALLECIHEEGTWSVPYRSDQFGFAGTWTKPAFGEMLDGFMGGFSSFSFEILNMIAEGDRVAIGARSQGVGAGGAQYQNVYQISFLIREGKLFEVREFFDPFEVIAFASQLPGAEAGTN